jgi:hypothetical protein
MNNPQHTKTLVFSLALLMLSTGNIVRQRGGFEEISQLMESSATLRLVTTAQMSLAWRTDRSLTFPLWLRHIRAPTSLQSCHISPVPNFRMIKTTFGSIFPPNSSQQVPIYLKRLQRQWRSSCLQTEHEALRAPEMCF